MPAKSPRVNTVLERPLYEEVRRLAAMEGVSVSQKVRDLVREALDLLEDRALAAVAAERENALEEGAVLSHEEVWERPPAGRNGA